MTIEYKFNIYEQLKYYLDQGWSFPLACKKANITPYTHHKWLDDPRFIEIKNTYYLKKPKRAEWKK